jgi:hypothetical protein
MENFIGKRSDDGQEHTMNKTRHRHEQSLWIIAGGHLLWCYQCGAWRHNTPGRMLWHKPTGLGGINPAMKSLRNGARNDDR